MFNRLFISHYRHRHNLYVNWPILNIQITKYWWNLVLIFVNSSFQLIFQTSIRDKLRKSDSLIRLWYELTTHSINWALLVAPAHLHLNPLQYGFLEFWLGAFIAPNEGNLSFLKPCSAFYSFFLLSVLYEFLWVTTRHLSLLDDFHKSPPFRFAAYYFTLLCMVSTISYV